VARLKGVDLRAVGSGNIGATNVGRALGRRWGVLVYLLDAAKGALPVLLAGWLAGTLGASATVMDARALWWWLAVAVCAVLGHMFTPLAGFRGGKGVATGSGALMAIYPVLTLPVLVAVAAWGATLACTRIMSISGMVAGVAVPVALVVATLAGRAPGTPPGIALGHVLPALVVTAGVAVLVIWGHRSNLARLRAGTEPRIGAGRPAALSAPKAR
jgi:glycerol-3-phosphate acyltransferase PlsY